MNSSKRYVEPDSQGVLRVGSLGVSLDSVVIAFQKGHSPETIQQLYPAISLEEVYGAVVYYLADNDLNDAIVVGTRRREPAAEFARLRDLGLATSRGSNDRRVNGILIVDTATILEIPADRELDTEFESVRRIQFWLNQTAPGHPRPR